MKNTHEDDCVFTLTGSLTPRRDLLSKHNNLTVRTCSASVGVWILYHYIITTALLMISACLLIVLFLELGGWVECARAAATSSVSPWSPSPRRFPLAPVCFWDAETLPLPLATDPGTGEQHKACDWAPARARSALRRDHWLVGAGVDDVPRVTVCCRVGAEGRGYSDGHGGEMWMGLLCWG